MVSSLWKGGHPWRLWTPPPFLSILVRGHLPSTTTAALAQFGNLSQPITSVKGQRPQRRARRLTECSCKDEAVQDQEGLLECEHMFRVCAGLRLCRNAGWADQSPVWILRGFPAQFLAPDNLKQAPRSTDARTPAASYSTGNTLAVRASPLHWWVRRENVRLMPKQQDEWDKMNPTEHLTGEPGELEM